MLLLHHIDQKRSFSNLIFSLLEGEKIYSKKIHREKKKSSSQKTHSNSNANEMIDENINMGVFSVLFHI